MPFSVNPSSLHEEVSILIKQSPHFNVCVTLLRSPREVGEVGGEGQRNLSRDCNKVRYKVSWENKETVF